MGSSCFSPNRLCDLSRFDFRMGIRYAFLDERRHYSIAVPLPHRASHRTAPRSCAVSLKQNVKYQRAANAAAPSLTPAKDRAEGASASAEFPPNSRCTCLAACEQSISSTSSTRCHYCARNLRLP